jgi:hypothetical protein
MYIRPLDERQSTVRVDDIHTWISTELKRKRILHEHVICKSLRSLNCLKNITLEFTKS